MAKQYSSPILAAIHETAEDLNSAGLMDKQTMREFDEACLTPVHTLSAEEIRALREREGASQPVFARYLNVTLDDDAGVHIFPQGYEEFSRQRHERCLAQASAVTCDTFVEPTRQRRIRLVS